MKDCAQLVKLFYKNGDCVIAALKKFESLIPVCGAMSAKVLQKMIEKFGTDSFEVESDTVRKAIALTLVENVEKTIQEGLSSGVQTFSAWIIA